MNHLTSCLGPAGLAPFVGGNFDSLAFSPTAAVYADHVIRQARRFAAGFALDAESLGLAGDRRDRPGRRLPGRRPDPEAFPRSGVHQPVFPRLSLEAWQAAGSPRAEDLLRRHTVELMASHPAPPDHDDLLERGEAWIARMSR